MRLSYIALLVLGILPSLSPAQSRPATSAQIELVREAMQERLKDADSAKFRNVRFGSGKDKDTICGDVNAKNSYGAYGGFTTFMAAYIGPDAYTDSATVKHAPSVLVLGIDDEAGGASSMVCAQQGI